LAASDLLAFLGIMFISRLTLAEFRLYPQLELAFEESGLRVSGRNGSGKTSLIEAISVLSTSRSSRSRADRELVRWESGEEYGVPPFARLEADVVARDTRDVVGITLEQDKANSNLYRKKYVLNGSARRASDIVGTLKTVLFSPEDVDLVTGSPSERRRQLDVAISQVDRSYLASLSQYGRVLANRNGLLKSFLRDGIGANSSRALAEIGFWNDHLAAHGSEIVARRERAMTSLGSLMRSRADYLIDDATMSLAYDPKQHTPEATEDTTPEQRAQQIHAAFIAELDERRELEFRRGVTLVGPHRDDVVFSIDGRDLAAFGSRGQQRLGVIAYKLAETDFIQGETGERPVLLLDDVLSELDRVHREMLLSTVSGAGNQLIVTSTDDDMLHHPALSHVPEAKVGGGQLVVVPR
jgi:DNA replication and repair protein RecF